MELNYSAKTIKSKRKTYILESPKNLRKIEQMQRKLLDKASQKVGCQIDFSLL